MKISLRSLMIIIIIFSFTLSGLAKEKDTKIETGTAQVRLEKNMTQEETYKKAEELAITDAIENAFGKYYEGIAIFKIYSGKSDFQYNGNTKVKGVWIETLDKKFSTVIREELGQFGLEKTPYITCTIKGRIKKIESPEVMIEFAPLSCPMLECGKTLFNSGEQLYFYFKSPINGYLNIYQGYKDTVYRLLPYVSEQDSSSVKIKSDKAYFFFTKRQNYPEIGKQVDEIELQTLENFEINTLYILFSEKNYFKPTLNVVRDDGNGYLFPRSLSKIKFEKWLSINRATLDDFLEGTVDIKISSEN